MSKSQNALIVGKTMYHKDYGKVEVVEAIPNTRTMVSIKCVQRLKGWNVLLQQYERYLESVSWSFNGDRTLNWRITKVDQYGAEDICHLTDLKPYEDE